MAFNTIIFDEIHRLATPSTKTYKAAKQLKADRKFGASATPVMNRATDVFGIFNILRPGVLGNSFWEFCQRYVLQNSFGGIAGYRNLDELSHRIQPYMIQKTLDQVGIELPSKTITDIKIELSSEEKKLYDQIKKEILFEIKPFLISKVENPVQMQNALVKIVRLSQLVCSMELLGDNPKSSKLEFLKDHLTDTLVDGNKAIIFCHFEKMINILERELAVYKPLKITGQVQNRQEIIDLFQAENDHQIILMTEAGGVGINLQRSNIVYNYSLPWSVGKYEQRIGRSHRLKQTKPVFVYNLLAGPIDNYVKRVLFGKQELSDRILIDDLKDMLEYDSSI